jgi:UDPglucose 6-dehydrogenase
MIQDVAEKQGNINAEVVCDALATSDRRIMGPGYMKPGMGDGGACHPRDNIALRWMAEELDLGYDLFDAVMLSREVQAENMAKRLMKLAGGEGQWRNMQVGSLPVIIVGKAYKPLVEYEAGSSSMLVGHYVQKHGYELYYYDEKTGDIPPQEVLDNPAVYLLAHNPSITYGEQLDTVPGWYNGEHNVTDCDTALISTGNGTELNFAPGSTVVDPWRKTPDIDDVTVIHYGNTRK